jgi:hypothetical protein
MNHQHTFNVGDRVRVPIGGQSGIVSAWGYDRVWLEDGRCFHQDDVTHVVKPPVQPASSKLREDFETLMAAVAEWFLNDYGCFPEGPGRPHPAQAARDGLERAYFRLKYS